VLGAAVMPAKQLHGRCGYVGTQGQDAAACPCGLRGWLTVVVVEPRHGVHVHGEEALAGDGPRRVQLRRGWGGEGAGGRV
jgi:hypothetical protein